MPLHRRTQSDPGSRRKLLAAGACLSAGKRVAPVGINSDQAGERRTQRSKLYKAWWEIKGGMSIWDWTGQRVCRRGG